VLSKINTRCSARFFSAKSKAKKSVIKALLDDLGKRSDYAQEGNTTLRRKVSTLHGDAYVSAGVYMITQEPPFLSGSGVTETRGAFLMLVELDDYVATFARNVGDVRSILPSGYKEASHKAITRLFASTSTQYEQIRLRSMGISRAAIRARSLEAVDLRGLLSGIIARRSIPSTLRYSSSGKTYSVVPSVARFREHRSRAGYQDLVEWAAGVISDLPTANNRAVAFLRAFPVPVELANKPNSVVPTGLLLHLQSLETQVANGGVEFMLGAKAATATTAPDQGLILEFLMTMRPVADVKSDEVLYGGVAVGRLVAHKLRYGIKFPALKTLFLKEVASGKMRSFGGWLGGQQQSFSVTFNDPEYGYFGGRLFRDNGVAAGGELALQTLETDWPVDPCTSEKGLLANSSGYSPTSLFGVTEQEAGKTSTYLICDDSGDEWADYVAINDHSGSRTLRFYHCKHRDDSLSASALHEVVSQALKNLGRLFPPKSEVARKCVSWNKTFNNLPRINGAVLVPEQPTVSDAFAAIAADPRTRRTVVLVVNFLSKAELTKAYNQIVQGTHVRPQVVQMIWLLSSFANACIDAGATPVVKCRV